MSNQTLGTIGLRLISTAAIGMLLFACGYYPEGKYLPTPYDGSWRYDLQSDQCGDDTAEGYSAAAGFSFGAYDDRYDFSFGVDNHSVNVPARGLQSFYSASTGEVVRQAEVPGVNIRFESYGKATGAWFAERCHGKITMTRVRR